MANKDHYLSNRITKRQSAVKWIEKIRNIMPFVDALVVILAFWLFYSGYWWLILLGLALYCAYVIYIGWGQVRLMMSMIDGLVGKYKAIQRRKQNDRSKD